MYLCRRVTMLKAVFFNFDLTVMRTFCYLNMLNAKMGMFEAPFAALKAFDMIHIMTQDFLIRRRRTLHYLLYYPSRALVFVFTIENLSVLFRIKISTVVKSTSIIATMTKSQIQESWMTCSPLQS